MAPKAAVEPPKESKDGLSKVLGEIRDKAVETLLAAGGFVTFVSVAGAVLVWARFYAAEVPPEQAVDALPKTQLVVDGAVSLTAFAALGLLGMAIVFAFDAGGRATKPMSLGLSIILAAEAVVVCLMADKGDAATVGAIGVVAVAAGLAWWLSTMDWITRVQKDAPAAERAKLEPVEPREGEQGFTVRQLMGETSPGDDMTPEEVKAAIEAAKAKDEELELPPPPPRFVLTWTGRGVLAGLLIAAGAAIGAILGETWLLVSLLTAVLLARFSFFIAERSGTRFAWYGITVFFCAGLFGTVASVVDVIDNPQVQPAAVILGKGDAKKTGLEAIYVAENEGEGRVWLASVATDGCNTEKMRQDSGRLYWVPRDDVVAMSTGQLQDAPSAAREAPEMLKELSETRFKLTPGPGGKLGKGQAVRQEPKVERIDPARPLAPGERAEIVGSRFGTKPTVKLGGVEAKIGRRPAAPEDDEQPFGKRLPFAVPDGAESGPVTVGCGSPRQSPEIQVQKRPVPVPIVNRVKGKPRVFRLDGSKSTDADGRILGYRWSAGDTPTQARTKFTLPAGEKKATVSLTVIDDDGLEATAQVSVGPTVTTTFQGDTLFCFDCATLSRPGLKAVRRLRALARRARSILIVGHTDDRGSRAYNDDLSKRRAAAVERALVSGLRLRGRPVESTGLGETKPRRRGKSANARRANRRVEITIRPRR